MSIAGVVFLFLLIIAQICSIAWLVVQNHKEFFSKMHIVLKILYACVIIMIILGIFGIFMWQYSDNITIW